MKRIIAAAFAILFFASTVCAWGGSSGGCPTGGCPSGGCPSQPRSPGNGMLPTRPQKPSNIQESQFPALVKVHFGADAMGSGFIADRIQINKTAIVVTCAHGYRLGMQITVETQDGRTFPTSLVGVDSARDVVVLQMDDPGITPMKIASEIPRAGEKLLMIGYAQGTAFIPSVGVFEGWTGLEKNAGDCYIRATCDSQPGCSGGPILNSNGEVVATVTGRMMENGRQHLIGPCLAKVLKEIPLKEIQ